MNHIELRQLVGSPVNTGTDEFKILVQSICVRGVLVPLDVDDTLNGKYTILDGNRRYAAVKELGHRTIPCIVHNLSDDQAEDFMIMKSVPRIETDSTEYRRRLVRHVTRYPLHTIQSFAIRFGVTEAWVRNQFGLGDLPNNALIVSAIAPVLFGICRECTRKVAIDETTRVPGHQVYECGNCGYPNSISDFWEVGNGTQ